MPVVGFPAPAVLDVVAECRERRHDRIWLLRTTVSITLTDPGMASAARPEYLGPGFVSVLGDSWRPFVDPISIFHKTIKTLCALPERKLDNVWVALEFRDDEFRVVLVEGNLEEAL